MQSLRKRAESCPKLSRWAMFRPKYGQPDPSANQALESASPPFPQTIVPCFPLPQIRFDSEDTVHVALAVKAGTEYDVRTLDTIA
jgi:hypothetical protein